jgi:hypothetical protein
MSAQATDGALVACLRALLTLPLKGGGRRAQRFLSLAPLRGAREEKLLRRFAARFKQA